MSDGMFEVEWTSDCPVSDYGELLIDDAITHQRYFRSRDAAIRFARSVLRDDFFGSVAVTPCHQEPYEPGLPGTFIEYDGDSEYVD